MTLTTNALTKIVELLLGDELVIIVGGGSSAFFELLGEGVQEGGPPRCRAKARNVEYLD